ncbi:Deoxyribose-phosphate aldolase [Phytophthora cinnamomi]|uniref:Deoxyribose-phosphate aldolase n=1 Tax=Phytophthora cinnamomi TaxID=4785 RepID=UPI003559BA4D|nr:Deoxyribose-phosphate aldolase [Phytophthora cinnamomi]
MAEAGPARKRPKRVVPFLEAHELQYGVRVVERDPSSSAVKSVLCMFCAAFGREDDPLPSTRQRARTQKPKYWDGPCFRTDNYKSHLTMMHPARWKEYQDLPPEAKPSFFGAAQALPKTEQPQSRRALDNNNQHAATTVAIIAAPQFGAPMEVQDAVKEAPMSIPASPASASGSFVGAAEQVVAASAPAVVQSPVRALVGGAGAVVATFAAPVPSAEVTGVTDFSLEATLQCQQFATLQVMDETELRAGQAQETPGMRQRKKD